MCKKSQKIKPNGTIYLIFFVLIMVLTESICYADNIQKIWKQAYDMTMKGEFEQSWKMYEELLIKNPKNYDVVLGAGCLKYLQAEKNMANKQLEDAKKLIKDAELHFNTAIQIAKTPDKKSASLFNKGNCSLLFADLQKDNPQTIEECISLYRNAIQYYRESLEITPDFTEAKRNLDHASYELKQLLRQKLENPQKDENKQDSQQNQEQKLSTMFVETKTDIPDANVHVLEEQPNVVELKKGN
ncbi:MAG TPA: hypothetical protein PLX23_02410 [Candidatus Hydrogenedens sp.]|nr:hypothetical protein [Candidatus Hydrogenedens sp.]